MSKANRLQSPWIPAFSGLRFLIIIFLCLHHFDAFNDLQVPGWSEVMRLLTEGYLSVNFFFILSGFVIQYSYGPQLRQGVLSTKSFLFNRFAHLWPTYLLALAAALVVYAGVSAPYYLKTSSFWCHVFMVQSWIPDSTFAFNFNGAAWSVSTEVFFYLLFPCLVQLKDKHRNALMVGLWGGILLNILVMGLASPPCRLAALYQPCIPSGGISLGNMAVRPIPHWPFRALQQKERHHYGGRGGSDSGLLYRHRHERGHWLAVALADFLHHSNRYSHLRFQL